MAVKTTVKKGNASTEVVLGQAAQQITKAVTELAAATATIGILASQAEELTLQVSNKEDEIAALDVKFTEKERQLTVDLDLSFKANTNKVVTEYLASVNKEAITSSELSSLRSELADVKHSADKTTKEAVGSALATARAQYENDIKLLHSENKAIAAENASKIGVLAEKNKFLDEQVTKLYAQLDAERNAGIERAKAGSVGSINIGDQGRK
jgi:hypothetical protein